MKRGRLIKAKEPTGEGARRASPEQTRVIRASERRAALAGEALVARADEQAQQRLREADGELARWRATKIAEAEQAAALRLLDAEREAGRIIAQAREGVYKLALAAAEKIVGRELTLHPEVIESIVAEVISAAGAARRRRVRVNPDDLPALEAARRRLSAEERAALQIEADASVARGGCLVETEHGEVDGRLEIRLSALAALLAGEGGGA